MRYGHFTVDTIEERHYAHYSIRKFKVCNRKVWIIEKKGPTNKQNKTKSLAKNLQNTICFRFALKLDGGNVYEYIYL